MSKTNSHECPYCGAINRHRSSSAGTTKRCDDCGRKYKVSESSGMGCLLWAILVPTIGVLSLCCMGVILAPFMPNKTRDRKHQQQAVVTKVSLLQNPEIWTMQHRPAWAKPAPQTASDDLKRVMALPEELLAKKDITGLKIKPLTAYVNKNQWENTTPANKRGIVTMLSLYFVVRGLNEEITFRDDLSNDLLQSPTMAEIAKMVEDEVKKMKK